MREMTVQPNEKELQRITESSEEQGPAETPRILEVINVEELAVDGICGIY
jgi:hypothetical protein